jgi:acyl dehydratase
MPLEQNLPGQSRGPVLRTWDSTEAILYALGVGAGTDELHYTTENTAGVPQQVVPSFAALLSQHPDLRPKLGEVNPAMAVHAEQSVELRRPLPVAGSVELTATVTEVLDKGSGALIVTGTEGRDPAAKSVMFTATSGVFIRGEGGFGGPRGASASWQRPQREPDAVIGYATWLSQPLLYRLSGDRNPLHSDPAFATRAGFPRPILHGMATYGMCCRALVAAACDGDPARLRAMSGRFSRPVLPGDQLTVAIWRDRSDEAAGVFQAATGDGTVVLDHGRFAVGDGGQR